MVSRFLGWCPNMSRPITCNPLYAREILCNWLLTRENMRPAPGAEKRATDAESQHFLSSQRTMKSIGRGTCYKCNYNWIALLWNESWDCGGHEIIISLSRVFACSTIISLEKCMFSTHTYLSVECLFNRTQKNKIQKKRRKVSKTIDRKIIVF